MACHVTTGSIDTAVHTVAGEVGTDVHYEDALDALYMILGGTIVEDHEPYVLHRLHAVGFDISALCEGHEDLDGPIGVSDYCNGTCRTSNRLS